MCSLLAAVLISIAVVSPALGWSSPDSSASSDSDEMSVCEDHNVHYGVLPHPYECDQYVLCKHGNTYELECPSRDVRHACEVSNNNNCHDSYEYHHSETESEYEGQTYDRNYDHDYQGICERKDIWDGVYPHPYECGKYVRCHHGVTQELVCPSPDVTRACNYKDSQDQCDGEGWYSSWDTHHRDGHFCEDRGLFHGVHADPDNCYGYIVCVYGKTNYIPCPAGTAFSRHERYCAHEYHVDCDNHGHWYDHDYSENDKEAVKEDNVEDTKNDH